MSVPAATVAAIVITAGLTFMVQTAVQMIVRKINQGDTRSREDAAQNTAQALLEQRVTNLERTTETNGRQLTGHGEELAALGLIVQRHEDWHAKHDPA